MYIVQVFPIQYVLRASFPDTYIYVRNYRHTYNAIISPKATALAKILASISDL